MAEEKNFELKVGLFVSMGILIFITIIFSIGDVNFVKQGYRIKTLFSFIDGVTESSPVRYAGVDVGHVEKIEIRQDTPDGSAKVEVTAYIDDPARTIERDSKAMINTLGLLGEKYVEIEPGQKSSGYIQDGEYICGKDPMLMSDITDNLNQLAVSAGDIMNNLREGKGTIGKLLVEEKIYDDLEAFVSDIKAHPWKLLSKPRGEN